MVRFVKLQTTFNKIQSVVHTLCQIWNGNIFVACIVINYFLLTFQVGLCPPLAAVGIAASPSACNSAYVTMWLQCNLTCEYGKRLNGKSLLVQCFFLYSNVCVSYWSHIVGAVPPTICDIFLHLVTKLICSLFLQFKKSSFLLLNRWY